MSTIEQFLGKKTMDSEEFCCGEQTPKPEKDDKYHRVPALSNIAPFWSGIAIIESKMKEISLRDYKGKYLILFFYPYDFTFICPTEMIQFGDRVEEFKKLGCEIVAISTDSEFSHLAWINMPRKQGGIGDMRIPILSDRSHEMSRAYGVLNEKEGVSLKSLFVIDKSQVIRHFSFSEVSLSRSVDETLRIVEACQFVDSFGETCPAGPRDRLCTFEQPNYFSVQ